MNKFLLLAILLLTSLLSCHHRPKDISFYYWRTAFTLDSLETATLRDNKVQTLYIRFFDVDRPEGAPSAQPLAPITFSQPISPDTTKFHHIIPVVFLRNRVFSGADTTTVDTLAANTLHLVQQISRTQKIALTELQFDCDWTDKTRQPYFRFLQTIRRLSGLPLSCTIRLHQVKYRDRTGTPPVDRGVLMYYNMGNIDTGKDNSIYERGIAAKYIPYLKNHPLPMDVALPIFSWGLLIRDGRVASLLNKMNFHHFENDTNFTAQAPQRFIAKNACFKGGYYFKEGDQIKLEHIDADGLNAIIDDINRYSNHRLRNIIFYDLDKNNLGLYDQKDFSKILDRFN